MWSAALTLLVTISVGSTETDISVNAVGATSLGNKVTYGDEDLAALNEVISNKDKNMLREKNDFGTLSIKPLPAQDVKCLISLDRYCSKEMAEVKEVLIQALKEDCKRCSDKQKQQVEFAITAMMVHNPHAWKLFLTGYLPQRVERIQA